jgi:hypothetical protein
MFYDMFHILLSCDSLRDPWIVFCIVLYCNGADVTGGQRQLCNDQLHDLYYSPNIKAYTFWRFLEVGHT